MSSDSSSHRSPLTTRWTAELSRVWARGLSHSLQPHQPVVGVGTQLIQSLYTSPDALVLGARWGVRLDKGFSPTCAGPETPVLLLLPSAGWAGTQPWQARGQTGQPGRRKAETS